MGVKTPPPLESNDAPPGPVQRGGGLTTNQWVVLIAMAGMLVAIGAMLLLVLRAGSVARSEEWTAALSGPTPTPTPPASVPDAVPTPSGLYQPPDPQPLFTPHAPGGLRWWDARFAYRQPVLLDAVASQAPAGTWARVLFDGESAQRDGKMRADGADLRVVVWDGTNWWEIPRSARPRREKRGWNVLFAMQKREIAQGGAYYIYYGNPLAESAPLAETAPETSRLLLSLDSEQGVEWGPEITWTANSTTTQTLVSPDGRVAFACPPGGVRRDTRVRLRTVPLAEKNTQGPLPNFELHADPPPGPPHPTHVVVWDAPLTLTINWAGLAVTEEDLRDWVHFAYDTASGTWYGVPVEVDVERGLIRVTSDQF
jgi:hypothetical protein